MLRPVFLFLSLLLSVYVVSSATTIYAKCSRYAIVEYLKVPFEDVEEDLELNLCPKEAFYSLKVNRIPETLSIDRIKQLHYTSFCNLYTFDWNLIPLLSAAQLNHIPWMDARQPPAPPSLKIVFSLNQISSLSFESIAGIFKRFSTHLEDSFCKHIPMPTWYRLLREEGPDVPIPLNALSSFTITHFLQRDWFESVAACQLGNGGDLKSSAAATTTTNKLTPQHWNRLGDSFRLQGFRHPCKLITEKHYGIPGFWEGINAECLRELPVLSTLPPLVVKKIPKTTLFTLSEEDIPFLSPSLALRLRSQYLEGPLAVAVRPMKDPNQFGGGLCSLIEPEDLEIFGASGDISLIGRRCFESLSPVTLNKMTQSALNILPDYLIGCLSGDQIMQLQPRFFERMNPEKFSFLGGGGNNDYSSGNHLQCAGFIGHHISLFKGGKLKGRFSTECLSQLNPAFFSLLLGEEGEDLMDHPFWSEGVNRLQIQSLTTDEVLLIPEEKIRILLSSSSSSSVDRPLSAHLGFSIETWKAMMDKWSWIGVDYPLLVPRFFVGEKRQTQDMIDRYERMHIMSSFLL